MGRGRVVDGRICVVHLIRCKNLICSVLGNQDTAIGAPENLVYLCPKGLYSEPRRLDVLITSCTTLSRAREDEEGALEQVCSPFQQP